jgi:hypothetical protein
VIRQRPHGFQLVFEYGLIFCHKRHSKQMSGSADQAVGRILRKRLREHGRQHGKLRRNLVDDNPSIFDDRSNAGFDRAWRAQAPMREQHGQLPKADRGNRYAARFGCFSNRGGGAARQAFGLDCQPNPDLHIGRDHLNRLSKPCGR